jgi:acetylornithine deacetylase/succinyl-diaminopimelate desuccinylase-like protein
MESYLDRIFPAYTELIKTLTKIPAPSHKEQQKAAYIKDWLDALQMRTGFPMQTRIDDATNVICECFCEAEPAQIDLFLAHTDTVFPDEQPLPVQETEELLAGPGIGDDTANVAAMMMGLQYLAEQQLRPQANVVFAFNSCEEGLGNLKGCRTIMEQYQGKVHEFISFDGSYTSLTTVAVGSERYDVCIRTEGGHSYGNFGNSNAIAAMAELICRLYAIDVRKYPGRTTYNAGIITGGTSVNTIAQEAHMLFEFRSDCVEGLAGIKQDVLKLFSDFGHRFDLSLQLLGSRPSMGLIDPIPMNRLINEITSIIIEETGKAPILSSGSTDCNIPLSQGIPAVCFGAYLGKGAHTRQEFLYKQSLRPGLRILIRTLLRKFH